MHNQKRLISVISTLALAMMMFVCPMYAVSGSDHDVICSDVALNETSLFSMRKVDDAVVYTMKRSEISDISEAMSNNFFETKHELSMIGMEDDEINGLTYAELLQYATSKNITASVSYIRTTTDGKQEYISEGQAICESKAANSGDKEKQSQETDEYMRIWHCVTHVGDGLMYFQTSARWLTMPKYRGVDSLGSCASYCSIIGGGVGYDMTAYIEYDCTVFTGIPGDYHVDEDLHEDYEGSFTILTDGAFYGSGFTFNLPNDVYSDGSPLLLYSDLVARFSYYGHVSLVDLETYFNSKANYSHSYIYLGATPSINFTDDDHTIGLDFSIIGAKEDRSTFLEFHYVP